MENQNNTELETMIQLEKERICEETGLTLERLEELKGIGQEMINDIKARLKPIDNPFERGFILNMVGEKCTLVSKLNFVDAMKFSEDNATEDKNDG